MIRKTSKKRNEYYYILRPAHIIFFAFVMMFPAAALCDNTREIETNKILAKYKVSMADPSSLNAINSDKLTPLAIAARENDRKAVELLLEKGAKLGLDSFRIKKLMAESGTEIFHELAKKFSISLKGSAREPLYGNRYSLDKIKYFYENRICGFENLNTESIGLWFERISSSEQGFFLAKLMKCTPEETWRIFEKNNIDGPYNIEIIEKALEGDNPEFAKYLIDRTPMLNFTSIISFIKHTYQYDNKFIHRYSNMDEIYKIALEHFNYEDDICMEYYPGLLKFVLNELKEHENDQTVDAIIKKGIQIGKTSLLTKAFHTLNEKSKSDVLAFFIDNFSDTDEIVDCLSRFVDIDNILKPQTIEALKKKGITTEGEFGAWVVYRMAMRQEIDAFIEKLNEGYGLGTENPDYSFTGLQGAKILKAVAHNQKAFTMAIEKGFGSKVNAKRFITYSRIEEFKTNLNTYEVWLESLQPLERLNQLLKNPSIELTSPDAFQALIAIRDFETIKSIVDKNVSRIGKIDYELCIECDLYNPFYYDRNTINTLLYICLKNESLPDCVIKIFSCRATYRIEELIKIGGKKLLETAWKSGIHLDRVTDPSYDYTVFTPRPVSIAVKSGNMEAIKFLVESGISKDTESLIHALETAFKENKDDISRYLADILETHEVHYRHAKKLEDHFVQKGHSKWIQKIVDGTKTPVLRECLWRKYITKAIEANQIGLMKDLIKIYPEMSVNFRKAKDDWSLFQYVIMSGAPEAFDLMIEKGALNPRNDHDIVLAARDGRTEFVRKLLEKGYNANARASGWTPLLLAAGRNDTTLAVILVAHGADVSAICFEDNYLGETPLSLAKKNRNKILVDLFRRHGASDDLSLRTMKTRRDEYIDRYYRSRTGGVPPIHAAARNNDFTMVEYFIRHDSYGIDEVSEEKNFEGMTPLAYAIAAGNTTIENILVDKGALKAINENPLSAYLIVSAMAGNIETLKKNLADGADVNARNRNGASAVSLALRYGHIAAAKLLLERGAEVRSHDEEGWTALHQAIRRADLETINYIISRGADIKALNKKGSNVVSIAASFERKDLVEFFHSKGVGLDEANLCGWAPLHIAILRRNETLVRYFIEHGADVNRMCSDRDFSGFTPLMLHEIYGKGKKIRDALVKAGARRNPLFYDEKNVALMKAVKNGRVKKVEALVSRGADVDSFDITWNTPLIEAVRLGRNDIVKILAKKSRNINYANADGVTAAVMAARKHNVDVLKILMEHGATLCDKRWPGSTVPLYDLKRWHDDRERTTRLLIENGADLNERAANETTPLMRAAQKNETEAAKLLIISGARTDLRDAFGKTALDYAFENSNEQIIRAIENKR